MKDFRNYHKKLWNNVKQIILDTERELPSTIYELKEQAAAQMDLSVLSNREWAYFTLHFCFACAGDVAENTEGGKTWDF